MDKQGFRKVDPDRWEFANEGFLRGQKHLLRNISRRKPAHGHNHPPPQQPRGQSSSVGACVEVGKFGLEEEVEQLKRDKNVLMQELVRLRQQQQSTDNQLQTMVQRLQGMEQRQQQMMSFLAKAVHSPGFLAQFVQQQNESNRNITEGNKKRRLKQEDVSDNHSVGFADGQIVKYQPSMNEAANAMLRQIRKLDSTLRLEPFNDGSDSYLTNEVTSPSRSSSHISGATLQEVSPTSFSAITSEIQSSPLAATSAIITSAPLSDMGPLIEPQGTPSVTLPQPNLTIPDLCPLQELGAENKIDVSREVYIGSEMENGGYIDTTSLGVNEKMPLDVDNLCLDPDMEWDDSLLDEIQKLHSGSDTFSWEQFLEQDPEPVEAEEMDSTSLKEPSVASEGKPLENGWKKAQHMDLLTEQMGLLSSENEKT